MCTEPSASDRERYAQAMTDAGLDADDVVQEERQRILTIEALVRRSRVLFEDVDAPDTHRGLDSGRLRCW